MSDYISREAFLAYKKWLYCTDCERRKGKKRGKMVTLYEIGEAPCKSCGIHDMLEEVEAYPAADVRPRWIPVTERLPKEDEAVLTWGKHKTHLLDWLHDGRWCCFGEVTHWMPLPEPPDCGAKMTEEESK